MPEHLWHDAALFDKAALGCYVAVEYGEASVRVERVVLAVYDSGIHAAAEAVEILTKRAAHRELCVEVEMPLYRLERRAYAASLVIIADVIF